MGVLTDFVVGDRADAQRVCDSDCPSQEFAGLHAQGIDTIKLGTLHAVLTDGEFNPSLMCDSLCSGSEHGPWVFELPTDLVQRLASLSPRELAVAGEKWAATEEFSPKYDNWPVEAVQQVLQTLAAMCKKAHEESRALLMGICL